MGPWKGPFYIFAIGIDEAALGGGDLTRHRSVVSPAGSDLAFNTDGPVPPPMTLPLPLAGWFRFPGQTADAPVVLRATVSVLNALQPVAEALRSALPDAPTDWSDADARLAREGRLAVFEGSEPEARALAHTLHCLGLTPSCHLRLVPVLEPRT